MVVVVVVAFSVLAFSAPPTNLLSQVRAYRSLSAQPGGTGQATLRGGGRRRHMDCDDRGHRLLSACVRPIVTTHSHFQL